MAGSKLSERIDEVQRAHPALAVTIATLLKFKEDRAPRLAATMAFWAFFSIFPLFLLFVSLLGYFLPDSEKSNVLDHVSSMFPLVDPSSVGNLNGSLWSSIVGGVTALISGTAVMRATEYAFNTVWDVPLSERPKFMRQVVRALVALSTIGVGLVVSTVISGFVTGQDRIVDLGVGGHVAGYAIAAVLDVGLFLVAFRMLTARRIGFRELLPGALLSGTAFWVLEQVSSYIISRKLHHAQTTYGHFATVITILWWFYLQSLITLLGAELNVVLRRHLYPRSMKKSDLAPTEERAVA